MKKWEKASKAASVARARKVYGGAAAQVVKSHVHRQKAQGLSRELRALLPPAPPAGVGIEMLPRGRGIKPIQKACGATARTLQLAAPYGRLHVTQPPLSVCVDASGERARPLS
jgi:hypothetical protein